mmetsp:Transcript_5259/g.16001  ORF Transcript_5259/g.16001 Transcript_5259/m.16001 type:complete len:225 (-) Transcript_5259:7-681(-)
MCEVGFKIRYCTSCSFFCIPSLNASSFFCVSSLKSANASSFFCMSLLNAANASGVGRRLVARSAAPAPAGQQKVRAEQPKVTAAARRTQTPIVRVCEACLVRQFLRGDSEASLRSAASLATQSFFFALVGALFFSFLASPSCALLATPATRSFFGAVSFFFLASSSCASVFVLMNVQREGGTSLASSSRGSDASLLLAVRVTLLIGDAIAMIPSGRFSSAPGAG